MASRDTQGRFASRELFFSARVLVSEVTEPRPGRVGTNMSVSPLGMGLASRGG